MKRGATQYKTLPVNDDTVKRRVRSFRIIPFTDSAIKKIKSEKNSSSPRSPLTKSITAAELRIGTDVDYTKIVNAATNNAAEIAQKIDNDSGIFAFETPLTPPAESYKPSQNVINRINSLQAMFANTLTEMDESNPALPKMRECFNEFLKLKHDIMNDN